LTTLFAKLMSLPVIFGTILCDHAEFAPPQPGCDTAFSVMPDDRPTIIRTGSMRPRAAYVGLAMALWGSFFAASLQAANLNLLTNGDFSAPVSTGWQIAYQPPNCAPCEDVASFSASAYAAAGWFGYATALNLALAPMHFAAFGFNQNVTGMVLAQALQTEAGADYQVSFQYGAFGDALSGADQQMVVGLFNGDVSPVYVHALSFGPTNDFTNLLHGFSFSFRGTGGMVDLEFYDRSNNAAATPTDTVLANVQLVTIPAPGSVSLMGAGLIGLAVARRRKR